MTQTAAASTNQNSIVHSTFCVERNYPQTPARVFHCFADKEMVRRWRVEGEGCLVHEFTFDFRVGGSEVSRFSFMGGPEIRLDARQQLCVRRGALLAGLDAPGRHPPDLPGECQGNHRPE